MLEDFLKDKKKTGICVLIAIVIIASGFIYYSSGYKDLKNLLEFTYILLEIILSL